jgi:hypothetical protein
MPGWTLAQHGGGRSCRRQTLGEGRFSGGSHGSVPSNSGLHFFGGRASSPPPEGFGAGSLTRGSLTRVEERPPVSTQVRHGQRDSTDPETTISGSIPKMTIGFPPITKEHLPGDMHPGILSFSGQGSEIWESPAEGWHRDPDSGAREGFGQLGQVLDHSGVRASSTGVLSRRRLPSRERFRRFLFYNSFLFGGFVFPYFGFSGDLNCVPGDMGNIWGWDYSEADCYDTGYNVGTPNNGNYSGGEGPSYEDPAQKDVTPVYGPYGYQEALKINQIHKAAARTSNRELCYV